MGEWIRFGLTAAFLCMALIAFTLAVTGVWKFGFVMNRLHAAGIGDTLGIFCVVASLIAARGFSMNDLKLVAIILFLWFTSPVSSHFLSQVEYFTNPHLYRHVDRLPEKTAGETEDAGSKKEEQE